MRAVRAAVGAVFVVTVKLNSADFQKGGFSFDECLAVIEMLNDEGVDLLEISGGNYEQPRLLGIDGLEPVFAEYEQIYRLADGRKPDLSMGARPARLRKDRKGQGPRNATLATLMPKTTQPLKVLVVCTGNSCRSIIGEALINSLGAGRFQAMSAGSQPAGYVHPMALETLRRHGIDPGEPRSQSWDVFADERLDYVITVCDSAAAETCPAFPGNFARLHWSTPDPAKATGTEEDITAAFERAFELLKARVQAELL